MVISFSFRFKIPALHKYMPASSPSKSSRFLIPWFLIKCSKFHSVFKILSKSHMADIFQFQACTRNVHINYDFLLQKKLNSHNLCIKWATMGYPDCQNEKTQFVHAQKFQEFLSMYQMNHHVVPWLLQKTLNLGMLSSCKAFYLWMIKWAIMWYRNNQLRQKLNLCILLLQANKNILCKNQIRIQNMYLQSISNYIM